MNVPIHGLDGKSFQEFVVRQPIRFGGLGIRSREELSPAAFIGAVELSLPDFVGDRGVCPQLENVVGTV